MIKSLLIGLLVMAHVAAPAHAAPPPIFDVHIHYSHDAWAAISPADAVKRLRAAGIVRALVSSSNDDGTQKLYQADPELVVPALRPYRELSDLDSWVHDDSVIPYLEQRLAQYRYVAIGELHLAGDEAELPVPRRVVQLARRHQLILHVHADADAIARLFAQDPEARILWAHAGFEDGPRVQAMLRTYPNLWADLSYREDIFSTRGGFLNNWRDLLITHADRFMLGIDTYTPSRWLGIEEALTWSHSLLAALPADAAERLAHRNADAVIGQAWQERSRR